MNCLGIQSNMAKKVRVIKNDEVNRLIFSKPKHGEVNVFVELDDEVMVFNHLILSNMSRAFHWVNGHPRLYALEMALKRLTKREIKDGRPEKQFIETERAEEEIQKEADNWLAESRRM
jgi:hypothetical protein